MKLPKTTFMGNLSIVKTMTGTKSDKPFSILNVAVNMDYYNVEKEAYEQKTEWYEVVCFGSLADRAASLEKGQLLTISAKLTPYKTQTQSGDSINVLKLVAEDIYKSEFLPKASMSYQMDQGKSMEDIINDKYLKNKSDEVNA